MTQSETAQLPAVWSQLWSRTQAEAILHGLAQRVPRAARPARSGSAGATAPDRACQPRGAYRTLLEQMPAVVFMAYLDRGIGEAYVSPQIEADPGILAARSGWKIPSAGIEQIHPDDKHALELEAAEMFLSGSRCVRSIA